MIWRIEGTEHRLAELKHINNERTRCDGSTSEKVIWLPLFNNICWGLERHSLETCACVLSFFLEIRE